jgi:hypothetical protein
MDRYWFFTWRTYGTWLPGEDGFVGYYHTSDGRRVSENERGAPKSEPIPALARYARNLLRGEPVGLTLVQAHAVAEQLREHAGFKGRVIDAIAVLVNHVHLVFGTPGDPDPDRMLTDWKAYASRALNLANPERQRGGSCGQGGASGTPPECPAAGSHPLADARGSPKRLRPVWWAEDGSKRPIKDDEGRRAAIQYVRDQENPLVVWLSDEARQLLGEPRASARG